DGFSKIYAMTGWRLGYGVMPEFLAEAVARLVTNCESCTATFTQYAGIAALTGPQQPSLAMVDEFRARRDMIVAGLNAIPGWACPTRKPCRSGCFRTPAWPYWPEAPSARPLRTRGSSTSGFLTPPRGRISPKVCGACKPSQRVADGPTLAAGRRPASGLAIVLGTFGGRQRRSEERRV